MRFSTVILLAVLVVWMCSSAQAQWKQISTVCLSDIRVTDGTTTQPAGLACLSTVNFTAPCTLTFQVTGPSIPSASGGPLQYAIVADQTIQGSTTSYCFGVINIAPLANPIFTYGFIPNGNPINCNGNQTETDSSISAYWATGGVSFAVQCVLLRTWLGYSCDYVTGAIQININ